MEARGVGAERRGEQLLRAPRHRPADARALPIPASLVGIVTGIGNRRGDVGDGPNRPLEAAGELGARLFDIRATDYELDTDRGGISNVTGVKRSTPRVPGLNVASV